MGDHLVHGEFQSDKYPTTPRGKVPLSCKDKTAQDLLWCYAQRRRTVDAEFSADLETALLNAGFRPNFWIDKAATIVPQFVKSLHEPGSQKFHQTCKDLVRAVLAFADRHPEAVEEARCK